MHHAVINVRFLERQRSATCRIDIRNYDLAISTIEREVLLYTPRHKEPAGYCGEGIVAAVVPDPGNPRFMMVRLECLEWYPQNLTHEQIPQPFESLAYGAQGEKSFHYFSPGIRRLTEQDQKAIERSASLRGRFEPQVSSTHWVAGISETSKEKERTSATRTVMIRDAKFRFAVIQHYGVACAVCGDSFGDYERGLFEIEACHIQPVKYGGLDEIWNALALCRRHHFAFDIGLFTMRDTGELVFSRRMDECWRQTFHGWEKADLPTSPIVWPKSECLDFHRTHLFEC